MAWRLAFLLLLALGLHLAPTAASADTTPPEFSSTAVRAGGTSIWLTMNEALDRDPADLPLASAFVVTVAGTDYPVAAVGAGILGGANRLLLTLWNTIYVNETVTVSYTDPTGNDDTRALQDDDGNDAASFSNRAVNNNSEEYQAVQVDFGASSYTFDEGTASHTVTVVARTVGNRKPTYDFTVSITTNEEAPSGQQEASVAGDYRSAQAALQFLSSDFSAQGGVYVASRTETITIVDDNDIESTEYFELLLQKSPVTPSAVEVCQNISCPVYVAIIDDDTPTTPPDQVTGVELTPGDERIGVTWDPTARATGYRVEWKSGSQGYSSSRSMTLTGGDTTMATITNLVNETDYTVRVIATNPVDDGLSSAESMATPLYPSDRPLVRIDTITDIVTEGSGRSSGCGCSTRGRARSRCGS